MADTEDSWQRARLIPTSGISGADEQETRATSALLSVLPSVREFGLSFVKLLGGPGGTVETFIEVPFTLADGRAVRPDGLIRSTRGSKVWTCLVEVKTGTNPLGREQVESYLDVARENGFDAVLTISNEIASSASGHPVDVDKKKVRSVALVHLSWAEVVSQAVRHRVHTGVSDPDQAWVLGELIRYLEHPKSGALDFQDMGAAWVSVRESIAAGTLRPTDGGLSEVVARWDQLMRFAALRLERELGTGVHQLLSRKELLEPAVRTQALSADLVQRGVLTGAIRIPSTVGDLVVEADLRVGRITITVEVGAPGEGKPATRVNWLTRQLQKAPDSIRVDSYALSARTSMSELLEKVREDPALLFVDSKSDLRKFRVSASSQMGTKRGIGRGAFIDSVLSAIDGFYATILQSIRPWVPKPPQLSKAGSVEPGAAADGQLSATEVDDLVASEEFVRARANDDLDAVPERLPMPALGTRADLDPPLVTWDNQLEDLADERQVVER
jgi:hypothetical protein